MTTIPDEPLTLAELESKDPRAPVRGTERRFLCPFCGDGKPQDASHRSLAVNTQTGAWNCHRCNSGGKLKEFWPELTPSLPRRSFQTARRAPLPPLVLRDDAPPVPRSPLAELLPPLEGSPGANYLQSRGLPLGLCHAAGVRYAANWFGRAAVVFPICDRDGNEIAAQGRYITPVQGKPNFHTDGPKKWGTFSTPGAWTADELTVVESPIDALSLAANGVPAAAFVGRDWPDWFPRASIAFRKRVNVAFDADGPGDEAAELLIARMASCGCIYAQRLRPIGAKDWNEDLLRLAECRRLSRKIAKQYIFLADGEAHPKYDRSTLIRMMRETLGALAVVCAEVEGEGAAGFCCALDPFADECLETWQHAMSELGAADGGV